ncbi:hypothetical protein G6F46_007623 [Rhizopus delemar]|uniref:Cyclin N-terminal domain-containing protein n=3 Tax=Rhizopus TaxID=4842 RepID=I1CR01_RHIO9|nr:hypothetical protein RO3G_15592 [Rhizopus delemar RA 99-880]KAG1057364.1 hypothetical protein G6F43_000794 [Rhizopus delemar]KAG1541497.1 hypothetical protein G6F51_007859 [Rhizopus arrhizus]KAG1456507.1 hypothetical protein G6F55_006465 [Rhizopus delemar]KAG1526434.1 hypothetical protein G6F52_002432 [Rhizopus delemar]|eukprot:EIE90881.1 hypothetical protein RO3G_15592 [Rhizopus delemar RA 99-880]
MKIKLDFNKTKKPDNPSSPYYKERNSIAEERENKVTEAYTPSYNQACLVLQAIQINGRHRLSPHCVLQLANYVAKAWEINPEQETIDIISKLMNKLLDTTFLCPEMNLNEALIQFCKNDTATQSVSPSITLLVAIDYISRLKQKYDNIKGTKGCGQRLILVAYMMASKYIHVNLKSIINTTAATTAKTVDEPPSPSFNVVKRKDSITLPSLKEYILPSPPTSPKTNNNYSDSNPLNYHYFKSPQKRLVTPLPTTNHNVPISRMELEFLYFLNYDLSINDTMKWVHWAHKFDEDLDKQDDTNSGYEGDTD